MPSAYTVSNTGTKSSIIGASGRYGTIAVSSHDDADDAGRAALPAVERLGEGVIGVGLNQARRSDRRRSLSMFICSMVPKSRTYSRNRSVFLV